MIGQMAFAIALLGFNDLALSVTPVFLLMDQFPYRFSTFSEKNVESLSTRSLIFLQMHHPIPFSLALRLSVRRFQMPLEGLSLKTLVTFGIIYERDPLLQNMTKIVDSPSIFLTISPVDHAELRAPIFPNQGSFSNALSLNRSQ